MINHLQKNMMIWVLVVIGASALFLSIPELNRDNNPRVVFLDVGQGDAIFITTPNGRQVLVDGGKYSSISMAVQKYMSLSDRSIDMIIATHPDIDHVAGLSAILDEYSIDYFVHSGLLAGAPVYRSIEKKVAKYNIKPHAAESGQKIFLDTDMHLEILSPYPNQKIEDANDHSIVLRIVYKNKSILLTGDVSKFIERNLVSLFGDRLKSEVLKLGHHGSKTSTDNLFVQTVNPQYGVVSAACNNSFGHPHASVLQTLDDNNVIDLHTCDEGDIVFEFKNGSWALEKEKQS